MFYFLEGFFFCFFHSWLKRMSTPAVIRGELLLEFVYTSNFSLNHRGFLDRALNCLPLCRQHIQCYYAHEAFSMIFMKAKESQMCVLRLWPHLLLTVCLNVNYSIMWDTDCLCLSLRTCRLCCARCVSWCFQWLTGVVSTAPPNSDFSWGRLSRRLPSSWWVIKVTSFAHVRSPLKVKSTSIFTLLTFFPHIFFLPLLFFFTSRLLFTFFCSSSLSVNSNVGWNLWKCKCQRLSFITVWVYEGSHSYC